MRIFCKVKDYIGIDFDGTCVKHKYPLVGEDIGAAPVLKKITDNGHKLILITMRGDQQTIADAKAWFIQNDIPLYAINTNPSQWRWTSSKKIYANLYIDDTALGVPLKQDPEDDRPYVDWKKVEELLTLKNII